MMRAGSTGGLFGSIKRTQGPSVGDLKQDSLLIHRAYLGSENQVSSKVPCRYRRDYYHLSSDSARFAVENGRCREVLLGYKNEDLPTQAEMRHGMSVACWSAWRETGDRRLLDLIQ